MSRRGMRASAFPNGRVLRVASALASLASLASLPACEPLASPGSAPGVAFTSEPVVLGVGGQWVRVHLSAGDASGKAVPGAVVTLRTVTATGAPACAVTFRPAGDLVCEGVVITRDDGNGLIDIVTRDVAGVFGLVAGAEIGGKRYSDTLRVEIRAVGYVARGPDAGR